VHARVLCAPYKGRALHVSGTSRPSPAPLAPARRLAGLEALTTSGCPEPCRLREAHVVPIDLLPAVAHPVTPKPFLSGLMFADRRPMCWKPHTPTVLSFSIYLSLSYAWISNVCFSSANDGCTICSTFVPNPCYLHLFHAYDAARAPWSLPCLSSEGTTSCNFAAVTCYLVQRRCMEEVQTTKVTKPATYVQRRKPRTYRSKSIYHTCQWWCHGDVMPMQ
jgi:hypothetical protein